MDPQISSAQDEPWWQEFTEQYGKESLRALAKRFGTNPRRLRRAAQRIGLADEPEAIRDASERLGKLPDASLAEELGVTPEQVKGARARRNIEAFNPKTLPQPKARPKKKSARKRPDRGARDKGYRNSRERFTPTEPTVVVKKPSRRSDGPARSLSRVEDSGRRLASTLGRLRKEESPSTSRSYEEAEAPRRRRVVGPDRMDELRGLKSSERESAPRARRRRLARKVDGRDGGQDDDGSGPGARERIHRVLSHVSDTLRATREPPAPGQKPAPVPAPKAPPVTRVLRRVETATAAPAAAKEAQAAKEARASMRPAPVVGSESVEVAKPAVPVTPDPVRVAPAPVAPEPVAAQPAVQVEPRVASLAVGGAAELTLWNAVYEVRGERREAVVSAPTFLRALERVHALGELLALTPAEVL